MVLHLWAQGLGEGDEHPPSLYTLPFLWLGGGKVIPCSSGYFLLNICLLIIKGDCLAVVEVCALPSVFIVLLIFTLHPR